jgi:Plasmid pRiA4b ORF-3-like protein
MKLHFSEQPILKDFDRFMTFLCDRPSLELTKEKGLLKGPDLLTLNEQMTSFQSQLVTNKSAQLAFSLLNTFFFIAQTAELFYVKKNEKNSKNELFIKEDRIRVYDSMTDDEKYITLLEAFWCYLDWDNNYECRSFWDEEFYINLSKEPMGKPVTIADRNSKRSGKINRPLYTFAVEVLSAFGFFDIVRDENLPERMSKYIFPYKQATLSKLGGVMLSVFMINRRHFIWHRVEEMYASNFLELEEEEDEDKLGNFEDVFIPLFEGLTIEKRLFPIERAFVKGEYHFKVSLGKNLYRVIAISSQNTFDDLHSAIQDAFDFDHDHLYAFFMDGKRWSQSGNVFWSPHNDEGIPADAVEIGAAGLFEGKSFLYLFDFGDEWSFNVTLKSIILGEPEPKNAKIIESVGENPDQYPDYEDD